MKDDRYKTLRSPNTAEIIVKKSRFITSASPVDDEEEALHFIGKIKKAHGQANHNVFAYVINEQTQRFSDDGEPSGTAGRPVLDVINRKGLVKAVIVVTRYFGGIMLGAGGLVRAYSEAAVKGIEAAGEVERLLYQELNIALDYHWVGVVKREVEKAGGKNFSMEYGEEVILKVLLRPEGLEALSKRLTDLTSGQVIIKMGGFTYY
ncbi:IMPACT family member YigZ [Pelotomaculum sp. FP]|uniref:YigZ family protein n=1 Tax=Pelotomaculum sp. FP TaxID=261474 RepID=UPI001064DC41|nr:YigZ family protein [Pelotomaculum sp. FP]TEB14638.1 IMPACT family member YigZ [Pelotomaculum sp. FP]